ncbi:RNA-binding domain-containing protein [Paracoccus sanguinis]|uniref:RNA-binding domain-containing protein n=1 Tax=Paracoccus sanguinis TaxID=1545044 RepID=UPI0014517E14|nr:RNA-binding domain-containing protein [Paracoccus sanguinis]QJD16570.1 transcriptional regulator [Paracoccus sanguinis]
MNPDYAINQIVGGLCADDLEGETLDFKQDKSTPKETFKMLSEAAICFANSSGGSIVLGVADKVRGEEAILGTSLEPAEVKERIYQLTTPPLNVEVRRHQKFSNVLLIQVPQSAAIHADPQGRATLRINKDCLPMSPSDQVRVREEKGGVDWSYSPSTRGISDVSEDAVATAKTLLRAFSDERRALGTASTADLLRGLGALTSSGFLNRAGALMFCPPDEGESFEVVYIHRETPGGEPKLVLRLEAPLLVAMTKVIETASARQSGTQITLPTGQQIMIEDFPSLAIREAVANAICHRDYHLAGAVHIEHSPNVFSVLSPGPLVSGVTPENIITTASRPRNPTLAKMARHLGLAEELGRGVDRMYRELIRAGRDAPRIENHYDRVIVRFVGGAPNTQVARFIATLPDQERDDTDTMLVIHALCASKTLKLETAANLLQKSVDEAEQVLKRLAGEDVGIIERTRSTASRSNAAYRFRSGPLKALGSAVSYQRRTTDDIDRKVIEHINEYGKITNRTLQNFFDVGVFKARDIIADLSARKILQRTSSQQRGPRVEWGPGPKFPSKRKKK